MLFENLPASVWERIESKARTLKKYGCTATLKEVSTYKGKEVISIELIIPNELEQGKWEFLGLKKVCGDDVLYFGDIPTEYHNTSMYCEHCTSNRKRNSVILIKDMESGIIKQVGKTCVKKYLGTAFDMLGSLLLTVDELFDDDTEEYGGSGYSIYNKYLNTLEYLYYCMQSIQERGYIKKDSFDNRGVPIDTTAWDGFDRYNKHKGEKINIAEVLEAIQVYKDFASKNESDFTHNVLTLLNTQYMEKKYINMVAFIPTFLLNKRKFEAEKRAKEEQKKKFESTLNNEYLGVVGEKISCTARLVHYSTFESYYTYRGELNYRYTFITKDGNLVQWKTQNMISTDLDKAIEDKTFFNIKGTVKEHREYNERFYTVLTRCKVSK